MTGGDDLNLQTLHFHHHKSYKKSRSLTHRTSLIICIYSSVIFPRSHANESEKQTVE
jgi:hypothetical protein